MPRNLIKTDSTIRALKTTDSRRRLSDGDGLYLLPFVNGGSHGWRLDYTFQGARKTLSLGTYPATGLALARQKADEVRAKLAGGIDPSAERKSAKARHREARELATLEEAGLPPPTSFEHLAREWFGRNRQGWAPSYARGVIRRLEMDVFPHLGKMPVTDITPPKLLEVIRRIEDRGVIETARRSLEHCSHVLRYAVASGILASDPSRDLKGALKRTRVRHFAAIIDPERLAQLLMAIYDYKGTPVVRAALRIAPLVLLRPGELRHARWEEFDLDNRVWTVPAARMKRTVDAKANGKPHIVPLATQVVEVLRDLHAYTGPAGYVFPGERHYDRPMSENTVNAALRIMGFPGSEMTGHGFRATARTLLDEQLDIPPAVIEAQLAHSVRDALGTAYNRTEFLAQRRRMMQVWADYLDRLRLGAQVIPFRSDSFRERSPTHASPRL